MTYTATISKSGQVTIPKIVRNELGVTYGDSISFEDQNGTIIIKKQPSLLESIRKAQQILRDAEKRNPKITELRKRHANMSFEEIRDEYDATPQGRKEFKERYGFNIAG